MHEIDDYLCPTILKVKKSIEISYYILFALILHIKICKKFYKKLVNFIHINNLIKYFMFLYIQYTMSYFAFYYSNSQIYKAFYWILIISYLILIPFFLWIFYRSVYSYYRNYLNAIPLLVILFITSNIYTARIVFFLLLPILNESKLLIIKSLQCACYLGVVSIINCIFLDISIGFRIDWIESKIKKISFTFKIIEGFVVTIYVILITIFSNLGNRDWMIDEDAFIMCDVVDKCYWGLLIVVFMINTGVLMVKIKKNFPDGISKEATKIIYSIIISVIAFLFFGLAVPEIISLIFNSEWSDTYKSLCFFIMYFSQEILMIIVLIFYVKNKEFDL